MFFKKKVGKGVRGEGKTFSPFLLFYFFFSPFLLSGRALWVGVFLLQNAFPSLCLRAEPSAVPSETGGSRWAKNFWEPRGRGVLHVRSRRPTGLEMLSLDARDPLASWGCLASPAAAMPRGCGTWPGSWCWLRYLGWVPAVPGDRQPAGGARGCPGSVCLSIRISSLNLTGSAVGCCPVQRDALGPASSRWPIWV